MTEKTKKYLKGIGIAYLLAVLTLIFKVCKNNKTNDFYTLTPETLVNGTFDIYDDNLNKVGIISYENEGEQLIVSIKGDEITGETPTSKEPYIYKSIEYNKIFMELKKYEKEYYYSYDTGESIFLICLLRPWFTSYSNLEKMSKKRNRFGIMKDRQTFMFAIINYELYDYALKYTNPTIQNFLTCPEDLFQIYRCFFIQEEGL